MTRIALFSCLILLLPASILEGQDSTSSKASFVRTPANPTKITPTKAADKAEIKLPAEADMSCFGGGGRYVLLRIPSAKQVAVLDVCEGKVVKYIPIAEGAALLAAGNEHLFILNPRANILQRWNLKTFEKEASVVNPVKGEPRSLLVGHATDGPLFVVGPNKFIDAKTFKEVPLEGKEATRGLEQMAGLTDHPPVARISADGRVLAWYRPTVSPTGLSCLVVGDNETKFYTQHDTAGIIIPGPDGSLFSPGGIFSPQLKRIGGNKRHQYWYHAPIPAAHGDWYLSLSLSELPFAKEAPKMSLARLGEEKPVAELGDLEGLDIPKDFNPSTARGLQLYDRVFLVPDAEVMAVVNGDATKVRMYKFDVVALLDKAGVDYLLVTNRPERAVRGETFTFRPNVKSKKGGVKVKLETGPEGMKVAGDGTVTWDVPRTFAEDSATAILVISDKSGQEMFHTLKLLVTKR
jgi:hypothetical protein